MHLEYTLRKPVILVDNTSAIKLAENPEFHKRSKHIDIIFHFNRWALRHNKAELIYIPSKRQLADILTKNLPRPQFRALLGIAQLIPPWIRVFILRGARDLFTYIIYYLYNILKVIYNILIIFYVNYIIYQLYHIYFIII